MQKESLPCRNGTLAVSFASSSACQEGDSGNAGEPSWVRAASHNNGLGAKYKFLTV